MLKIVTVFKTGDRKHTNHRSVFDPIHVLNMRDMCKKHITIPFQFYCLTNDPQLNLLKTEKIPLKYKWPTWWSKFELFNIKGPVLYFDLDIIIRDNIDNVINTIDSMCKSNDDLCMLDHRRPSTHHVKYGRKQFGLNSSIMYYKNDMSIMIKSFLNLKYHEVLSQKKLNHGDQDVIKHFIKKKNVPCNPITIDNIQWYNGFLEAPNKNPSIIYFTGSPRPWEQKEVIYPG